VWAQEIQNEVSMIWSNKHINHHFIELPQEKNTKKTSRKRHPEW